MLQLTAIGRLTKDAEIKTSKNGNEFVVFSLAVNKGYGDNQSTVYISCYAGGNLISPLSKAQKGSLISITGDLSTALYQKNDGTIGENIKCSVSSFYFIPVGDGKKRDQQSQNTQVRQTSTQQYQNGTQYQNSSQVRSNSGYRQEQYAPNNYEEVPIHDSDLPF